MTERAPDLARRLADNAEAVCRTYLSKGCRESHTWRVGDVENTPGRSLSVRLESADSGNRAAGKWIDFATGEHGDLLDVIARSRRLESFRDVFDEARRFLGLPTTEARASQRSPAPAGSPLAARRLFASGRIVQGTIAETYLHRRGITDRREFCALRFHPTCFYRAQRDAPRETWPALLAAVTNLDGTVMGVLRTWLMRDGSGKAPLATPRRALGHLLGNGVRFGAPAQTMAAGEGIETVLSLRLVLPHMSMVAALSASHLAALILPPSLQRLYIVRDNDAPGCCAAAKLSARAEAGGIETVLLTPQADDFNTDLVTLGRQALTAFLRRQLASEEMRRFLGSEHQAG
jgi:hypothetical protein